MKRLGCLAVIGILALVAGIPAGEAFGATVGLIVFVVVGLFLFGLSRRFTKEQK